jgi:hypothetical protein
MLNEMRSGQRYTRTAFGLLFDMPETNALRIEVDAEFSRVTASLTGLRARSARFRDGLGCTLE